MKDKIKEILPNHRLITTQASKIFIVDYKKINGGEVELLTSKPTNINSVFLDNNKRVSIYFDGFQENALPLKKGLYNRQCECVLFPKSSKESDWILFIETKYANNRKLAFQEKHNYPNCMIDQIIKTVDYFRNKNIISPDKRVTAIVSFPNLIKEFNSVFFSKDLTALDILTKYKILIRATNSATIKSEKRISLNAI